MASNHTRAQKNKSGDVLVQSTTTDAPLIPVEQLAKLKEIAPDRVDWIFEQTQLESEFRRTETKRIHTFTFVERICGLLFALLIAMCGLGSSVYSAMNGFQVVASVIGGATLVGLVTAFIVGKSKVN